MNFFGGGKKKEDSKTNAKANAFGVDPALFEDPKFDEDDEVDLPEGVDVQAILNEVGEGDVDVQVTDDDMNDPDLLAELNEISGGGADAPVNKIQALREQVALEKKRALEFRDKKDLVNARQALTNAKNLQAQLDELTASQASHTTHAPAPAPTPVAKPAPAPAAPTPAVAPVVAKPAPRPAPVPKDVDEDMLDEDEAPEAENKQAVELRNRIKAYKMAALSSKQAGNRPAALQYMSSVKILEKALEDADMGFPVDMKGLPPAVPPPPGEASLATSGDQLSGSGGSRLSSPPMTVMTAAQKEALQRQQTLEALLTELAKMVELHKSAAITARDAGDKTGAGAALKQMKEYKAHYDSLVLARSDPSIPLPAHHYETKETKHEVAFDNIAPHELEVSIINIKDLKPPAGYTSLSLMVYGEVQFGDKDPVQKIQTNTISNTFSPVYNHTQKLMIERNKSFQRFVEKKKIVFQVNHTRFLLGNVLIGKAEMKLEKLLEKAEVEEELQIIKEGTKRPVGGTVRVRLRLKTPLVAKDVRITKETILVIDGAFPSIAPNTATTPTTTPNKAATPNKPTTPATAKTPATPATASAKTPAASPAAAATQKPAATTPGKATTSPPTTPTATAAPKPAAGAPQKPAAAVQKAATGPAHEEMDLDDVNSVENIISNDVMENEMAAVDAQIATYAQKKQPPPEALVDRKQNIELKMSILVIQVQSGQITPEKYVDMLKAKCDEEMVLAKKLVAMGKKDWAKYPLQRVKIMKAEIESASAADEDES